MCGIVVSSGFQSPFHFRLFNSLKRRGPDGIGFWTDGNVHFGHTRLAIIGLDDRSAEPLFDNRYVLTYNGEIYNFLEIKERLVAKGVRCEGANDAEVLLRAWNIWGREILGSLYGFWAFAIYDRQEETLTLVRDQLGIKPLYFWHSKEGFCAASRIKTILDCVDVPVDLNYEAISEYCQYQFTFGDKTFLKHIHKVLPGEIVTYNFRAKELRREKYEDILSYDGEEEELTKEWIHETQTLLQECVLESTISDASFTCFCSGGVDSSLITRITQPDIAYHANFSDPECNETFFAQRAVDDTKTRLFVVNADEDFELVDRLRSIVHDFDELSIGSVILPLENLLDQVRRRYKVILTGTGGDELFGGYVRYMLTLGECNQDNYRGLFSKVRTVSDPAARFEICHKKGDTSVFPFYEPKVEETFREEFRSLNRDGNVLKAMLRFDQRNFLSGLLNIDDKMCGRHSLEGRPSFLHQRLVRRMQRVKVTPEVLLRDGELKPVLRQMATGFLPQSIITRKDKMGFTTPIGTFVNKSAHQIREQITSSPFRDHYNLKSVRFNADTKFSREVFGLLMLDLWLNEYGQRKVQRIEDRLEKVVMFDRSDRAPASPGYKRKKDQPVPKIVTD